MDKFNTDEGIILLQIKLLALSKMLISKGIITEEELLEQYKVEGKLFQDKLNNE